MKNGTKKKVENLYRLMEKLAGGEEAYPQNTRLQAELEVDERTLRRYLEDIHRLYGHIVVTEKKSTERGGRRVTIYRVADREKDVSEIFRFFVENEEDLGWLLQLVHENDPRLLREGGATLHAQMEDILKKDESIFQFVGSPFENLENPTLKNHFKHLRTAVKNREYRDIYYNKESPQRLRDVKCLKLFHMNDNWYLAAEMPDGRFRFLRLAFIEKIGYSKGKSSYRYETLEKYAPFFKHVQNAMTIPELSQKATLQASANVAVYFREGMKPFFPSQTFVEEKGDGSVVFTVDYTQPMEILPFIKHWLPDIEILRPDDLKKRLKEDLQSALERLD